MRKHSGRPHRSEVHTRMKMIAETRVMHLKAEGVHCWQMQEQEEALSGVTPKASPRNQSTHTLVLDPWPPGLENRRFCCLKFPFH